MRLNTLPRRHRRCRARGGTFLGLTVGVVVGLAAALAVAIYVAKVPIPFVNKAPVHNSDQDAAEDQKNRNWNPNTPLQTRGPTVPVSSADSSAAGATPQQPTQRPVQTQQAPVAVPPPVEVTPPTTGAIGPGATPPPRQPQSPPARPPQPTPPPQPVQPQARTTPPPPIAPIGGNRPHPTPSVDVLGDFATARARAAGNVNSGSANTAATAEPFIYYVQTGAFSAPRDADAERARLSLLGMEAAVSERDQAGRVFYRVRVGPFQNKVAADQVRERLAGNGFDAALVRAQR